MIHEYRYYNIREGQMAKCHEVFKNTIIPLLDRLGAKNVAHWEPQDGNGRVFVYLLGFQDAQAREKVWAEFANDAGWKSLVAELGDNAPWEKTESTVLVPTDYSSMS